jgi:CRISPR-associated protein Cmr4
MPIQRESHTGFPKIEASSLKGSIRHAMEKMPLKAEENKKHNEKVAKFLGTPSDENGHASNVAISDARLLFFPVKSAKGVFAWVTCPSVLRRFVQDAKMVGVKVKVDNEEQGIEGLPELDTIDKAIAFGDKLVISGKNNEKIMLEELVFDCKVEEGVEKWFEGIIEKFPKEEMLKNFLEHLAIIPDNDFEYFVTQSTEVVTRIRIGEDGVVESGALFTEEYLPSESIFYSLLFFKEKLKKKDDEDEAFVVELIAEKVVEGFKGLLPEKNILQIGGNMTLGKGLFKMKLIGGDE